MIISNLSNRSTLNYATIARDLAKLQLFTSDGKTHNVNKDFYVELVMSPRDISDKFRCDIAPRFGVTFDVSNQYKILYTIHVRFFIYYR